MTRANHGDVRRKTTPAVSMRYPVADSATDSTDGVADRIEPNDRRNLRVFSASQSYDTVKILFLAGGNECQRCWLSLYRTRGAEHIDPRCQGWSRVHGRRHWFAQTGVRGTIGNVTYTGWCSPFLITPNRASPNGYELDVSD